MGDVWLTTVKYQDSKPDFRSHELLPHEKCCLPSHFLSKVSFNYNPLYLEAFTFSLHLKHNCVLKHANTNH